MTHDLPDEWSTEQSRVFSAVYDTASAHQSLLTHPQAPEITPRYWQCLVHNMAWLAASAMEEGCGITIHDDKTDEVIGTLLTPMTAH